MRKKVLHFGLLIFCSLLLNIATVNAQWQQLGLSGDSVNCIVANNDEIYAGTNMGLYKSSNSGLSWSVVDIGIGSGVQVLSLAITGNSIFAGTTDGLYLSMDNGVNWNPVNIPSLSDTLISVSPIVINGTDIIVGACYTGVPRHGGIYQSANNGVTWNGINNGLDTSNTYSVFSIFVNGSQILAGTNGAGWISNDDGATWSASGTLSTGAYAVIGDKTFAGCKIGWSVQVSDDNCATWTDIYNEPGWWTHAFLVNGSDLIQAAGTGVFVTKNNGVTWEDVSDGLPTKTEVFSVSLIGTKLYIGTSDQGIWSRPLSEVSSFSGINDMNKDFYFNIHPNPAIDYITVNLSLDQKTDAKIELFDVVGQRVKQASKFVDNGSGSMIDVSNLPAGSYFIKVTIKGGSNFTKKVMIAR